MHDFLGSSSALEGLGRLGEYDLSSLLGRGVGRVSPEVLEGLFIVVLGSEVLALYVSEFDCLFEVVAAAYEGFGVVKCVS